MSRDILLSVLDRSYDLPPVYLPADLVPASRAVFSGGSGSKLIRAAIVDDLIAMRAEWTAAGLVITIDVAAEHRASGLQLRHFLEREIDG